MTKELTSRDITQRIASCCRSCVLCAERVSEVANDARTYERATPPCAGDNDKSEKG